MAPFEQTIRQAVVVDKPKIDPTQVLEQVVFFKPDGTPFNFDIDGELPADLEEHVLSSRPHVNAESGLDLAQMYHAGRI